MSELVKHDVSTESICTVIENSTDYTNIKEQTQIPHREEQLLSATNLESHRKSNSNEELVVVGKTLNGTLNNENNHKAAVGDTNCDTVINHTAAKQNASLTKSLTEPSAKTRSKLKKSVSFDPNDEKIRKFITGEPIVDQRNPFKNSCSNGSLSGSLKKKKTPPPVPTKRSTLSVKKTVTQQLREREREKEKEKERLKNETNNRKSNQSNGSVLSSPDEFITTEEVLKQSKYVKTYIKNPDSVFVYDPSILARIKFEELRELTDKKPLKKLKLTPQTRERLKDLKHKPTTPDSTKTKLPTFKKCSKPNYPELSDIKIKVGTELDGSYFNPAEVTKNAKKFDERVKKLHLGSDVDLDEIDEPLTKSESSDEVTANCNNTLRQHTDNENLIEENVMNGITAVELTAKQQPVDGTFTNTIKSREFQEYLNKKGLTIIPKKIPSGAQPIYTNGIASKPGHHISFKAPERVQISIDTMDTSKNAKKPSVFQRLLANSIFAARRKTTPKETVPSPRNLYETNLKTRENGSLRTPVAIKRVVLERQSFHGRPRASNMLSTAEIKDLKNQAERSRKSFASGDDISVSISSALTNAEYANTPSEHRAAHNNTTGTLNKPELKPKPIVKPPRRTLSRDRLGNLQQAKQTDSQEVLVRPKVQRTGQLTSSLMFSLPKETTPHDKNIDWPTTEELQLRRTLERQSLIPKRATQASDRRQAFGRSVSMDRNEILKRNVIRGLQHRSKSNNETLKDPLTLVSSKENLGEQFSLQNGPKLTSTPVRESKANNATPNAQMYGNTLERKAFIPITNQAILPPNTICVDQQEWEQLKAIKERTDRELYYRMLQAQPAAQAQNAENIYEHLQPNTILLSEPRTYIPQQQHLQQQPQQQHQQQPQSQQIVTDANFIRGSPQRNTFSGVIRNRQAKIIDGKPLLVTDYYAPQPAQAQTISHSNAKLAEPHGRSQSVLDGMTMSGARTVLRRGYESDTETPVIYRRKNVADNAVATNTEPRRIGGLLTREEILQKVKEFCRKSINRTPISQQPQVQAIYEKQPLSTDISPVSYASVETHQQRPGSRMYAAPQVPQRMQSLPQQFIPISHEILSEQSTASPIYAHVIKRSSLQSNQSEMYESSPRPYIVRRESDAQAIYVRQGGGGTLQRADSAFSPAQYIIVDSEKLSPAPVLNYYQGDIYQQPQYIRPHQLQAVPGAYGYITVRETMPPQQQQQQQQMLRARLHDGRSTPLILDRSSQQASQIYWTPQHQRLQQHAGLLPLQISPRYTSKQPYPLPAPRMDQQIKRASQASSGNTQISNIPHQHQQQQQQQHHQQLQPQQSQAQTHFPTILHANAPAIKQIPQQLQQQPVPQPRQQLTITTTPKATTTATIENNVHNNHAAAIAYDWESGSEAGEVQRILEHQTNNDIKYAQLQQNG